MHISRHQAACGLPLLLLLLVKSSPATTLDEALIAAEHYSAELSANRHQRDALENLADSALQLPDPKVKFGIENVPVAGNNHGRLTRDAMTMQRIGFMQEYVSLTRRERKADSIRADARRTASNAAVIRARLQRETARAWLALALAEKTLKSVQHIISETTRQTGAQIASVASGSASADSVLELKLALNAMKNEEDNARRDVQLAQEKLWQLTGEKIYKISGSLPPIGQLPADETTLMNAVKQHPEILQARRDADLAQAKSAQSAVAAIPNVGVEVYYAHRADRLDDMVGIMFSVDLPLLKGRRQDKDHAADVSRTHEAGDRLTQLIREHQSQVNSLIFDYNAAKSRYQRQQNDVLPLLQQRIDLLNAQYRSGTSTLSQLLVARRAWLDGQIARDNAEKILADAWTALRYLVPQDVIQ